MSRHFKSIAVIFFIIYIFPNANSLSQTNTAMENQLENESPNQSNSTEDKLTRAADSIKEVRGKIDDYLKKHSGIMLKTDEQIKGYFSGLIAGMEDLVKRLSETSDFMEAINELILRYEMMTARYEKKAKDDSGPSRQKDLEKAERMRIRAQDENERQDRIRTGRQEFEQKIVDLRQAELDLLETIKLLTLEELSDSLNEVEESINTALGNIDTVLKIQQEEESSITGN